MSAKFKPKAPAAVEFRAAIEAAERDGVSRADMVLRLTLRDASDLRRDRTVAVQDIRYQDGQMHFLDVEVVAGGVEASRLDRGA